MIRQTVSGFPFVTFKDYYFFFVFAGVLVGFFVGVLAGIGVLVLEPTWFAVTFTAATGSNASVFATLAISFFIAFFTCFLVVAFLADMRSC